MRRKYLKSRSWNYIHNLNRLYNSKVKALRDESEVSDILPHYQHVANNILQRMYSLEGKFKYAPVHDRLDLRQNYFSEFSKLKSYLTRMYDEPEFKWAELNKVNGFDK